MEEMFSQDKETKIQESIISLKNNESLLYHFFPQSSERLDLECFVKNYNIINNPENTIQWGSK